MPELYDYQRDGVAFLRACTAAHGAAVLADATGLGKTPQFLSAPPDGAPVIACVPAALKPQTAARIVEWRGRSVRVRIADGIGSVAPPRQGEWLVLNSAILPAAEGEVRSAKRELRRAEREADGVLPLDMGDAAADPEALERRIDELVARGVLAGDLSPGTWLLVDEAHDYSSPARGAKATDRVIRMRALCAGVRRSGGSIVLATATPILNSPTDLSGLLTTAGLHRVAWPKQVERPGKEPRVAFDSLGFVRDWGGTMFPQRTWLGAPRAAVIAERMRRVMLRRLFRDYAPQVPPMLPAEVIDVDLDADTSAMLTAEESRVADLWRATSDELTGAQTLRIDGARVSFEMTARVRAAVSAAKLPAALAWCERMERLGEPHVVVDTNVATVRAIGKLRGTRVITGAESIEHRAETVRLFQRGDLIRVALTAKAGGVGIDLYRARFLAILNREWNPAWNRQSLARVWRIGQTREVQPVLFRGRHPFEDRLDELLAARREYLRALDACAVRPGVAA